MDEKSNSNEIKNFKVDVNNSIFEEFTTDIQKVVDK